MLEFYYKIIKRKKIIFHCDGGAGNCKISQSGVGVKVNRCCSYCRCKQIAKTGLTVNKKSGLTYLCSDPKNPARDFLEKCEIDFASS